MFSKGRQLFGIDVARAAAAKAGSVVLAEGYTDVIALHQAGFGNAVGVMGTALTAEQAREIGGLASRRCCCASTPTRRASRPRSGPPPCCRTGSSCASSGCRRGRTRRTSWGRRAAPSGCAALLEGAVPFARFQIERTLERAARRRGAVRGRRRHPLAAAGHPARRARPARLEPPRDHARSSWRARCGRPGRPCPRRDGARPPARAVQRRAPGARPPRAVRARRSSPSASRCPSSARRSWGPSTSTPCSARPPTRRAAELLRGHLATPSSILAEEPELVGLVAELARHRQPPRRHPGDARARGAPARPPPPRPRDQRRPDAEGERGRCRPSRPSARRCSTRSATPTTARARSGRGHRTVAW